ncbi:MAG: hypothetical protein U0840_04610 [Gemmataceae bacterium]
MPNDARLGLVVGVTLVILVAVLFARKDGSGAGPLGKGQTTPPFSTKVGTSAPVPGVPGMVPMIGLARGPRTHTVEEGESLMSLAVRYYGDAGHVSYLFQANQDRILAPDRVPIGTILRIPDAPRQAAAKLDH